MADYYDILGVDENASGADIKSSFRKLAQKHHPDRGGNEEKFKEINEAYDTLKDPQKKAEYDNMRNWNAQGGSFNGPFPFEDLGNAAGLHSVFTQVFGRGFGPRGPGTSAISIQLDITLEDVINGVDKQLKIRLPSGNERTINVNVPQGIEHGTRIRYAGLGEVSHPQLPPGDIILTINIKPMPKWEREHDDLVTSVTIDCFHAMTGCEVHIEQLDGKTLNVKIPEGTQPGQRIRLKGKGINNSQTRNVGSLIIIVEITIPRKLNMEQKALVTELIKHHGSFYDKYT